MNIGFIGLGIMGRAMALNLRKAGFTLRVWARREESMQPLVEAGALACANPAEVAAQSDVVISMVSDAPDVAQVALGPLGVAAGAARRSASQPLVFIDMSTIAPARSREIAEQLAAQGVVMLDAPVSGGEPGAIAGTLTIMVGGDQSAFKQVQPVLAAMGKTITWIGACGAGQVAKACNQILTGVGVVSVAEALHFARRNGVNLHSLREVLLGGLAFSKILENHGARMIGRQFLPGFKAWMHQKDMNIVLQEAHALKLCLPTTAVAGQLFNAMGGSDLREQDSIAVLRLLERMNGEMEVAGQPVSAAAAQPSGESCYLPGQVRIGVIGLGVMGQPIVLNLLKKGYAVSVWARRQESATTVLAAGADWADTPKALAAACDVVISIVTSSEDVRGVVQGTQTVPGLLAGARPGMVHIDMSTIAPEMARELAARCAEQQVVFLDAPVSGGGVGAQNATLAIMAGGDAGSFQQVLPVLETLGKKIVHVGPSGAGQITKACNQMMLVCLIQACAEAARLASASGVDFARVREALLGGSAASRAVEIMGERMVKEDFTAGIAARLHHKDFGLLMNTALMSGCVLPIAAQVWQQLNQLMACGFGEQDTSVLLRVMTR